MVRMNGTENVLKSRNGNYSTIIGPIVDFRWSVVAGKKRIQSTYMSAMKLNGRSAKTRWHETARYHQH